MSGGWKTNNQMYGSHYGRSSTQPKNKIGRNTVGYLESLDKGNFIHEEENIAKRERHGLFTQPLGLAPGDPYRDPEIPKPEKRVEVNQRMQQKVGPELFTKPGSTNLNDPYKDPFRANQLYIKQKGDLSIHNHAFMAGGKQKLVKHSQFQHMKEYNDKQFKTRDQNGKVITNKKNIYTNNMKKGFGSTTTGHLFGSYPYQGYPEEDPKKKDQKQKLIHKAKIPTPFKGVSHPNATFTPNYALYNNEDPYKQTKDDELYRGKSMNNWKYNNPNKKGYNGTFTAFPPYIEEGEKEKKPVSHEKPWMYSYKIQKTQLQWDKQRDRLDPSKTLHRSQSDGDQLDEENSFMIRLVPLINKYY